MKGNLRKRGREHHTGIAKSSFGYEMVGQTLEWAPLYRNCNIVDSTIAHIMKECPTMPQTVTGSGDMTS